jgi:hypothetical protein
MNERNALERRVAALIGAYADRAPIEVDATAMTRLAAAGPRRPAPLWFGYVAVGRGLAFTFVLLALLLTIAAGALLAGGQLFRRDPVEILTDRAFVEPFVGLPPEGIAPSTPETGQLVISFAGRVHSLGLDFHRMWLYADGRLIWKSNLEGSDAGWKLRFGASEPTTAVIEQRLTPEGVELMRSRVMAAGLLDIEPADAITDGTTWHRPGVLWGGLVVHDGGRFVDSSWSDGELPELLADPVSWIPASAWDDPRISAYVPSRYAVCLGHGVPAQVPPVGSSEIWALLPESVQDLIRSNAIADPIPEWHEQDSRCLYAISTDDVAAIVAGLEEAGLHRDSRTSLSYSGIEVPSSEWDGVVQLLVVVPNGDVVCECG